MFTQFKLYIYAAVGAAFAVLMGLLKYKSMKLKIQEQIVEHQKEELKLNSVDKVVSEEIRVELREEEKRIEEEYDEIQFKAISTIDDTELSAELIQLLKSRNKDKASTSSS